MEVSFTKMSVKGQVVIPKDVRDDAGFETEDKLVVYSANGTVIMRKLFNAAAKNELERVFALLDSKMLGLVPEDVEEEISASRKSKASRSL